MRVQIRADAAEENQGFEPFPEGDYLLECVKVEDKRTRTGRDMVVLELKVSEGPSAGRKLWHNLTLIPAGEKGHGFTVAALHAFRLPYDGELDFSTEDFIGRNARAHVAIEEREWEDKVIKSNKVAYFITGDGHPQLKPQKSEPVRERFASKAASEDAVPF